MSVPEICVSSDTTMITTDAPTTQINTNYTADPETTIAINIATDATHMIVSESTANGDAMVGTGLQIAWRTNAWAHPG